jgi:uncharacterized protein (TIGR03000 family)
MAPGTDTKEKDKDTGTKKEASFPKQGRLLVELPPDARLYVDGREMSLADIRHVLTPELTPGREYFYTLKVEAVRDGKPVEESRRLTVRAGQVSRADFRDLGLAKKEIPMARPALVTVHIPNGAQLYVDGAAQSVTAGTRTFNTPSLEPGTSYYYTFKVEMSPEDKSRSETRHVIVQSGKEVSVDFNEPKALVSR